MIPFFCGNIPYPPLSPLFSNVYFGGLADVTKEKISIPNLVDRKLPQVKETETEQEMGALSFLILQGKKK